MVENKKWLWKSDGLGATLAPIFVIILMIFLTFTEFSIIKVILIVLIVGTFSGLIINKGTTHIEN